MRRWGCFRGELKGLLRSEHRDHFLPLLGRWLFKFRVFREIREDVRHDALSFFDVSHFASFEHDGHLDFVFMFKEADCLTYFGFDVMVTGFGAEANFFGFSLVCFLARLLILFVLILAEIHDTADWWSLIGGDFDQVESCVPCSGHRFIESDDAILRSVWANHAEGGDADLTIDPCLNAIDRSAPCVSRNNIRSEDRDLGVYSSEETTAKEGNGGSDCVE